MPNEQNPLPPGEAASKVAVSRQLGGQSLMIGSGPPPSTLGRDGSIWISIPPPGAEVAMDVGGLYFRQGSEWLRLGAFWFDQEPLP